MNTAQEHIMEKDLGHPEDYLFVADHPTLDKGLALGLERIRLRGYRRVLWQRHLWETTNQFPAQGLAIPHEEVDIACLNLDNRAEEVAFYESETGIRGLNHRIIELEDKQKQIDNGLLADLVALFSLSPIETDFLLLCVAGEIDPRLRRLYGYLHDDAAYCAATPWLAHVLFEWNYVDRIAAESSLLKWLLAYPRPSEEEPWNQMARWSADSRIFGFLTGNQAIAPSLSVAAQWLQADDELAYEPTAVDALRQLLVQEAVVKALSRGRGLGEGKSKDIDSLIPAFSQGEKAQNLLRHSSQAEGHPGAEQVKLAQLIGAEGIGRKAWAAHLCAEQGLKVLCLDAPRTLRIEQKEGAQLTDSHVSERLIRAEREALLQGCALYWDHADQVPVEVWSEAPFKAPVQLFGVEQPLSLSHHAPYTEIIPFALPTPMQAQAIWQQVLPKGIDDFSIAALAERFTLTPAEIHKVAAKAHHGREALWAACRSFSHGRLGRLATLLPTPYSWDDIVLPKETTTHLHEIETHVAHRVTVLDQWGFGKKRPLGRGVSALFAGPSGTGKTMATQVLAASMGVVLFRIDLASVVSKYIGETEKNLRQIFDEAERLNAVLFFDEADALFGKRTEVKDAHDRYANIEVNYLLQRMESYEGLAILATNRKGDIDSAFLRRLRFIVDFPMPGVEERLAIWRLALPEQAIDGTPLLDDINWNLLASRLEISGASIKDIALGAAFLACNEGTQIEMGHIGNSARRELMKHGRMIEMGELGGRGNV